MSNEIPRTELTKTIMSRRFFLSGDEFTSSEIASNLSMSKSTAHAALVSMYNMGMIHRRKAVHKNNPTIFWSRKNTNWNRVPWRMTSNADLGVQDVTGPNDWGLGDIASGSGAITPKKLCRSDITRAGQGEADYVVG